jgi:hypothetical protein
MKSKKQEEKVMSDRVRYGKVEVARNVRWTKSTPAHTVTTLEPKNTLLTIRDNDLIHFGIARCNNKLGDRFDKNVGKLIATNRARLAASEAGVGGIPGKQIKSKDLSENLIVHKSGLRGTVKLENIVTLLRYFQNIDQIMLPERLLRLDSVEEVR